MAQIIFFPGTTPPTMPAPMRQTVEKPTSNAIGSVVTKIRRGVRVPKANRPEDTDAITFARIAASFSDRAYTLAQTEPNSEGHRLALHMGGISDKLPRNNLRVFTTPEDVLQGLWKARRRVEIDNAEWVLADMRRMDAFHDGDQDACRGWSATQREAEARVWLEYERLIRIPATSVSEFDQLKRGKWLRGATSIEWMRERKPELAAVIDGEVARLNAEKTQRAAARAGKKRAR